MRRIKGLKINCHFEQNVILNLFQDLRFKRLRNKFGMTFRLAFTLAEVLITLTIIGVIAALTIPNLAKKWQDQHTVSAVKEAYSILNNAYKMAIAENGTLQDWNLDMTIPGNIPQVQAGSTVQNQIMEHLLPYLKVEKYCGLGSGCLPNIPKYKLLNGSTESGSYVAAYYGGKTLLKNGMSVSIGQAYIDANGNATWSGYGPIRVDINGNKGPNRFGYDVFFFAMKPNGIIPAIYNDRAHYCSLSSDSGYVSGGLTCADWIIRHNNVDYKYRDVSSEW